MSEDPLKDYFSSKEKLELEPRADFKQELIEGLHVRIARTLKRRKLCAILGKISAAIACIVALYHYVLSESLKWSVDFSWIESLKIDLSEISFINLIIPFLFFTIIFLISFLILNREVRKLKRKLKLIS